MMTEEAPYQPGEAFAMHVFELELEKLRAVYPGVTDGAWQGWHHKVFQSIEWAVEGTHTPGMPKVFVRQYLVDRKCPACEISAWMFWIGDYGGEGQDAPTVRKTRKHCLHCLAVQPPGA